MVDAYIKATSKKNYRYLGLLKTNTNLHLGTIT